jgi:hypothetical protein
MLHRELREPLDCQRLALASKNFDRRFQERHRGLYLRPALCRRTASCVKRPSF